MEHSRSTPLLNSDLKKLPLIPNVPTSCQFRSAIFTSNILSPGAAIFRGHIFPKMGHPSLKLSAISFTRFLSFERRYLIHSRCPATIIVADEGADRHTDGVLSALRHPMRIKIAGISHAEERRYRARHRRQRNCPNPLRSRARENGSRSDRGTLPGKSFAYRTASLRADRRINPI